jgi:hypothetical protein
MAPKINQNINKIHEHTVGNKLKIAVRTTTDTIRVVIAKQDDYYKIIAKRRAWVNIERETYPRDPEIQNLQLPLEIQKPQPPLEIQSAPQPSYSRNDQTHSVRLERLQTFYY